MKALFDKRPETLHRFLYGNRVRLLFQNSRFLKQSSVSNILIAREFLPQRVCKQLRGPHIPLCRIVVDILTQEIAEFSHVRGAGKTYLIHHLYLRFKERDFGINGAGIANGRRT
jgi:hypothetical protein